MPAPGAWLITLTLLLAAFLVSHVALLVSVFRGPSSTRDRWLALVPPLLPWVAFRAGSRAGAAIWLALFLGYVLVRALG